MTIKTLVKYTLVLTMLVATLPVWAQLNGKPSAVLIMLMSEKNRIKALEKSGKPSQVEEVKSDAAKVIKVTKNDFKDHFSFCPVYYFMDTDLAKIVKHEFAGVVTRGDSTQVAGVPADFVIAYYGFPIVPKADDASLWKGIVVADNNGKQVHYRALHPLRKYYHSKSQKRRYTHVSAHFDIDYRGLADALQEDLMKLSRNAYIK